MRAGQAYGIPEDPATRPRLKLIIGKIGVSEVRIAVLPMINWGRYGGGGQCRQDSGSSNQRSASKSADTRWAGSSQAVSQSSCCAKRSRASSR